MKKNMMKSALAALAVSALALSATGMSAVAGLAKGYTTDKDYNSSEVKPTISLTQKTLKLSEAKDNLKQTITLSVAGAAGKYAPTGIHVDYDSRLKLVLNEDGDPATLQQGALKISECVTDGTNGLFLTTGAKSDAGKNGALWTFDVELPADVKGGDKFEFTIRYREDDLFTNVAQDAAGELMQAYAFAAGVDNGYIKIVDDTPTTTTSSAAAGSTTTTTSGTGKAAVTTAKTTKKPTTTTKKGDSPKTGVAGAGVAVAGLAVAVATAFALRKKED